MEAEVSRFVDLLSDRVEEIKASQHIGPIPKVAALQQLKSEYLMPMNLADPVAQDKLSHLIDTVNKYIYNPELLL